MRQLSYNERKIHVVLSLKDLFWLLACLDSYPKNTDVSELIIRFGEAWNKNNSDGSFDSFVANRVKYKGGSIW